MNTDTLADFVQAVSYDDLPDEVVTELKKRVLDSLGIAIGAMGERPPELVKSTVTELDEGGPCTLWGEERATSPSQAAMYNTALVRYLDYMDSFLAPGETPHPSDNIAAAVVCGEEAGRSGKDLIEAVGIAYEVQAALAWNAPVRDRGWDHVTHTTFSATAAAGHMLGLDRDALENAIGIAGTAHNALRVTRTGTISMWKGLASANTARNAVYSAFLAKNQVKGPTDVFDGEKGWKHIVSGDFDAALDPQCTAVEKTMTKKYVAETYAQSAVEGIIELVEEYGIDPANIERIHLDTFHGAYQIIGGGAGGDRHTVEEREQADHSLPYMLAVAALDGTVMNEQYAKERIRQDDVQDLLQRVTVEEDEELTARFESGEMPAVLDVTLDDGTTHSIEKTAFEGHPSQPASWEVIEAKFHRLADGTYSEEQRERIVAAVEGLEDKTVKELVELLSR